MDQKEPIEKISSGPEKSVEAPQERIPEKYEAVPSRERETKRRPPSPKEQAPGISAGAAAPILLPQDLKKIKKMSRSSQLKILLEIALDKGIHQAIGLARDLDNPYLLDEFHDALIDELRQRLVEAGKLKKI